MSKPLLPILFVVSSFLFITYNGVYGQAHPFKIDNRKKGFIENKGQIIDQYNKTNTDVKYLLSTSGGMNIQLKQNGFSYDTYVVEDTAINRENRGFSKYEIKARSKFNFHRVDVQFAGAAVAPRMIAEQPLSTYNYSNRSVGSRVQSFARITYKNLYPFIDLVFENKRSAGKSAAEYYFVVRPGGDPGSIQWKYNGALRTQLIQNHIEITIGKGKLFEHIPRSFLSNAIGSFTHELPSQKDIPVSYKQINQNHFGFSLPVYDHTRILIIDPTPDLVWGTYFGDDLDDECYGVVLDQSGNIYITGQTQDANNIATAGAYQTIFYGFSDVMVGKFNDKGRLLWMTYYGGTAGETGAGIALDHAGNIVITGATFSEDHVASPGAYQSTLGSANLPDAFVAKFTSDGNLLWSTYFGGEDLDYGTAITVDADNNIFLCGFTTSTARISTPGAYQSAYGGSALNDADDGFIARFTSAGALVWSTYYGGLSFDRCYGIGLDKSGSVFVTGPTNSTNNMSSPGAYQANLGGAQDAFLAKFSGAGARLWSTYYGGADRDFSFCLAMDSKDNVIIAGQTQSTDKLASAGAYQPTPGGGILDGFLAKFSNNGVRLWGSFFGGEGDDQILALATGPGDALYFTGSTFSTTGIATPGSYQTTGGGATGVWSTFLGKFNGNGERQWGTYYGYGGPYGEGYGQAIVVDALENAYVTGFTSFSKNIATCGAQQLNWVKNFDVFLAKFGTIIPPPTPSIAIASNTRGTVCKGTL